MKLWDEALSGQIYLGGEAFVQRMLGYAASRNAQDTQEVPVVQRRSGAKPLAWYFEQHGRDDAIAMAYLDGGYTQTAIAKSTGLSVSRVSRLIKANEAKSKTCPLATNAWPGMQSVIMMESMRQTPTR